MEDRLLLAPRILRVIMEVVRIFSLLPPIHLVNSFESPRKPTSSRRVVTNTSRVDVLIHTIENATGVMATTDLLGGAIETTSTPPTIDLTEILGRTSLLGGTKPRPHGTGTIVLGGTRPNRPSTGAIRNGTVRHRRVTIKLQA